MKMLITIVHQSRRTFWELAKLLKKKREASSLIKYRIPSLNRQAYISKNGSSKHLPVRKNLFREVVMLLIKILVRRSVPNIMFRLVKLMSSNPLASITIKEDAKHTSRLIGNSKVRARWIYMRQTWTFGDSSCQKTKYKSNLENNWLNIKTKILVSWVLMDRKLRCVLNNQALLLNTLVIMLKLPN